MAFRQRDMHFQRTAQSHPPHRPYSTSETSSSSDDRDEAPIVRQPPRRAQSRGARSRSEERSQIAQLSMISNSPDAYPVGPPAAGYPGPFRSGTLRSTRSVPALAIATWDGEPCPVHGGHSMHPHGPPPNVMRRYGSLYDLRGPIYNTGPPPPMLDKKMFHGSMQMLPMGPPPPFHPSPLQTNAPIPPLFLPPMMRPRPMVYPAVGMEPLPMRDPYKLRTPPPGYSSKVEDQYTVDKVCCQGHLIVLWIILAVVTIGVILGIILGVTIT
ncbi:uncharacterized protein LOC143226304 [Tachypleus tridentatus]|uniref:uncharacterized protein LOC143226304 n=1 Tax=Tachypleus tridentatus TaxID=6853 RepID=UPI003FD3EE2C